MLSAAALFAAFVALGVWRSLPPAAPSSRMADSPAPPSPTSDLRPQPADLPLPGLDDPLPETLPEMMEEARLVVGRLVERFPQDPLALDCAAKAHLYLGNAQLAAELWERCLQADPNAAFAWEGLGRVAVMRSEYEQAAERFQLALDHCPASVEHTWRADCASQLADMLMKLGRIAEAIQVLERYVRGPPESHKVHLLLGQLYLQSQDFEQAKEHFQATLRLQPDSHQAHFGLSTALARTGQAAESREHMSRFQELQAQRKETRAAMRFQQEEPKELAVKVSMTHTHCGEIYRRHADPAMAERHWERASQLSPENATCRVDLAELYEETRRPQQALKIFDALIARDPTNPLFRWQAGRLSAELGNDAAARMHLEALIELAPDRAEGYAALAACHLASGSHLNAARRLAEQAVRLEPDPQYFALLARVCAALGDTDGARRAAANAAQHQHTSGGTPKP